MSITGKCYCGAVQYEAAGDALMKLQCHCRECQYLTGGAANLTMGVAKDGFAYTKGAPAQYSRDDLDAPVTRDFCDKCGTPLATHAPAVPQLVLLKVGSLDDPSVFESPQAAIYLCDKQNYHLVADDIPSFDRLPE